MEVDESLADSYLREAGYDPERLRGRKSAAELQAIADAKRRAQWQMKNSRKRVENKQVGLLPPRRVQAKTSVVGGGFILGFLLGKMF